MATTFRNKWVLAGALGLLLFCSFGLFSSQAHAEPLPARTPPPSDQSARSRPFTTPTRTDDKGRTCNLYFYQSGTLVDCTNSNGTIETCYNASVLGQTNMSTCDTRDGDTIVDQNAAAVGSTGEVVESNRDPVTGEVTTQSSNPVVSAIGSILSCTLGGPISCLVNTIAYLILQFANLLLAIAGTLFNWVIMRTVFQFATFLGNAPGLLIAWGILRDIGNMVLLFGFIFIGLSTILDLQTYAAKKALPRLLIFAILMNFSLFAAEAVIDTSNILSTVMYRQTNTDPDCDYNAAAQGSSIEASQSALTGAGNCFLNNGIAGRLMQATGAQGIFEVSVGDYNSYQNAVALLMLALFATVSAIVLFAGSILLVIRAVTLSFLMVGAPLGFAGMAVPPLKKLGEDWWNRLLHQSFFAPIYLLLIFVSLKIAEGFSGNAAGSLAAAVQQTNPSTMGIILVFMLMIGFLIGALVAAKKFGAAGASFAVKTASGITAGSMAWAGRNTAGAASYRAGNFIKKKYGDTAVGGAIARGVGKLGSRSFDFRASNVAGLGAKTAGLDMGKPDKDAAKGYEGVLKAKAKIRTDYADSLPMTDEERTEIDRLKREQGTLGKTIANGDAEVDAARVKIEENKKKREQLTNELNEAITQMRDAAASGNLEAEVAARSAQTRISDEIAALKTQADDEDNFRKTQQRIATKNEAYANRLKEVTGQIEANDPKVRYARDLERFSVVPLVPGNAARKKAAKEIILNAKKSETQKIRDALGKVNKNLEHADIPSDDSHGGGTPTPPPTAPAGGGAH